MLFAAVMAIAETNTLASVALFAPSFGPSANLVWDRNGRYGVFASLADNLVPGQASAPGRQVFLYDRVTGTVQLVSHVPGSATTPGNDQIGNTVTPQISADGKWVIYSSEATDLVSSQVDGNGGLDVFLWSRENDITTLVSHRAGAATTAGDLLSQAPPGQLSVSDDGRFAVFSSGATNLVAGQGANGFEQVYLHDRTTGAIVLVSHAASGLLQSGGERSTYFATPVGRAISGDGRWVVFVTLAVDLVGGVVDSNGGFDLYLWDRQAPLASSLPSPDPPRRSPLDHRLRRPWRIFHCDGRQRRGFHLERHQCRRNDRRHQRRGRRVFATIALADVVELASHAAHGPTVTANGAALFRRSAAMASQVAFHSLATNHVVLQDDTNGDRDVFLWQGAGGPAAEPCTRQRETNRRWRLARAPDRRERRWRRLPQRGQQPRRGGRRQRLEDDVFFRPLRRRADPARATCRAARPAATAPAPRPAWRSAARWSPSTARLPIWFQAPSTRPSTSFPTAAW